MNRRERTLPATSKTGSVSTSDRSAVDGTPAALGRLEWRQAAGADVAFPGAERRCKNKQGEMR